MTWLIGLRRAFLGLGRNLRLGRRTALRRFKRPEGGEKRRREDMKRIAIGMALLVAATGIANAAGDPAAGKTVFMKCMICHKVGPGAMNGVGPQLNGVVGRKAGTVEGYAYSDANKNSGLTWDE